MPSLFRSVFFPSLSVAFALACSGDPDKPDVPVTPVLKGSEVRFALGTDAALPPFLDVPFPSDIYLQDGHITEQLPGLSRILPSSSERIAHELAKMDGFSRIGMSHFYVDDRGTTNESYPGPTSTKIDRNTIPKGEVACAAGTSSVFLVDLEAAKESARIPCRAYFHTDGPRSAAHPTVGVGPARGVLLKEGHRYAAVITSRVKGEGGVNLEPSAEWTKIVAGDAPTPRAKFYSDAYKLVDERLREVLGADQILGIAPFTTNTNSKELFKLRDIVEAQPAPVLQWSAEALAPMGNQKFTSVTPLPAGFTATLDDYLGVFDPAKKLPSGVDDTDISISVRAHDQILSMGTAAVDVTTFLNVPPGSNSNSYTKTDFATFTKDANGVYVPFGKEKIWVSITLPKTPMPAEGYPLVIYAHGLDASRHVILQIANTFAAKGWAVAAIDSVTFGARSRNERWRVDKKTDYESAPGAVYKGPDGIGDASSSGARQDSSDLFGSFANLGAARDQFRQSAIDMAEVSRALTGADMTPLSPTGAALKIDPARIAYQGNSLGAIEGSLFAATEPRIKNYIFGVIGGGLVSELVVGSYDINSLVNGGLAINFDLVGDLLNSSNPVASVFQTVLEPADPMIFAPHLITDPREVMGVKIPPRNFLQTEVIYDSTVPNDANEAFMRAAGIGVAAPNVGSNAEITDIKNIANNAWRVPFVDVPVGADGTIHDTPVAGVTAFLIQVSPSGHGIEFIHSSTTHSGAIPFGRWDTNDPYSPIPSGTKIKVKNPYRSLQTIATQFFQAGFEGKVPAILGTDIPAAVRDYDGDGDLDDVDADASNSDVK